MEFQSKGKIEKEVINTRHILFIVSGAFNGLPEIIRKRVGARKIGFTGPAGTQRLDDDFFPYVRSSDFIEFGFESEFVGRLPVVVSCHELSTEDLFQILKHSEGSIIRQYIQAFDAYGIDLKFTDSGLHRLAEKAHQEKTGARSLVGVCERTFREFKYHLPHSSVRNLEVTAELVESPWDVLKEMLDASTTEQLAGLARQAHQIASQWSKRYGLEIRLQEEAARLLGQESLDSDRSLKEVFQDTFKNYEHGLSLIRKTRGINSFEISSEVVSDPDGTLDRWIRSYFIKDDLPSEGQQVDKPE
jgi:hypothetical protein